MPVPVKEAADILGVTERRVVQLVAAGRLDARRAGERMLLIDDASLEHHRRQRVGRGRGRPYSQRSAWALIDALLGRPPSFLLSPSERNRAHQRARNVLSLPPGALRSRAQVAHMRAHRGVMERLGADRRLARSGAAAVRVHSADIVILDDVLDSYVSDQHVATIVDQYRLRVVPRSEANVFLRIAPAEVPLPREPSGVVPSALLALDLIDDADERSVRAGRLLLIDVAKSNAPAQ